MKVLGLHVGHNATAVIMDSGKIVGALSQEKFDNIKNSAGFPKEAIKALLKQANWQLSELDHIAIASNTIFPKRCYEVFVDFKRQKQKEPIFRKTTKKIFKLFFPNAFIILKNWRQKKLFREAVQSLKIELTELGLEKKPLSFVEHHLSHARAAYHAMDDEGEGKESLIFTLDGSGDGLCASVRKVCKDGSFILLGETPLSASLGLIYSSTTLFLGMHILRDEHKVMGLSPYAKRSFKETYELLFKGIVQLDKKNPFQFTSKIDCTEFYDYLKKHAVGERFDHIAASLQHLIEEQVEAWVKEAIKRTGIRRLFVGGGVFMNVKLNKRIQEMNEVEQVFFMPSCGDESIAFGAAYDVAVKNGFSITSLPNLYLGCTYSDEGIEDFIFKKNLDKQYVVNKFNAIEEEIAKLLAARNIVARFAGRGEWGARSLGNRAILAHPSFIESFYEVNEQIKCRDFWMPFAPSMLDSSASKYLKNYDPTKNEAAYMITAHDATELALKDLSAAIHHGDHSLRAQVVKEEANPGYYHLIKFFEKLTGIGAVLNTSLNIHGFPLAMTLDQALYVFENSKLKYLALGSFLISKSK